MVLAALQRLQGIALAVAEDGTAEEEQDAPQEEAALAMYTLLQPLTTIHQDVLSMLLTI